jgi:hypothetical protein
MSGTFTMNIGAIPVKVGNTVDIPYWVGDSTLKNSIRLIPGF